jgi:hypothetical protein
VLAAVEFQRLAVRQREGQAPESVGRALHRHQHASGREVFDEADALIGCIVPVRHFGQLDGDHLRLAVGTRSKAQLAIGQIVEAGRCQQSRSLDALASGGRSLESVAVLARSE